MRDPLQDVSRETRELLRELERFFRQWAGRMNLVAPSTLEILWQRHILDSLQLVHFAPAARCWLDLGSGGGFPGLVVASALKGKGAANVDLIESSRKKAAFLSAAVATLHLPAKVHVTRIEDAEAVEAPEIIMARALAPLSVLLDLSARWLVGETRGLFHKGRSYEAEVAKSRERWMFDLVVHPSMTEEGAAILEIADLRPRAE